MYTKLFLSGFAVSISLLLAIPCSQLLLNLVLEPSKSDNFSEIIWYGVVAETLRGFIVSYLYKETKRAGSSFGHALQFGMLTSLLVATLWCILGAKAYHNHELVVFLLSEGFIMGMQGLFSGIALWLVFKNSNERSL